MINYEVLLAIREAYRKRPAVVEVVEALMDKCRNPDLTPVVDLSGLDLTELPDYTSLAVTEELPFKITGNPRLTDLTPFFCPT